jgi:hypothetical protein
MSKSRFLSKHGNHFEVISDVLHISDFTCETIIGDEFIGDLTGNATSNATNANKLDNEFPNSSNVPDTVVVRDANGDFSGNDVTVSSLTCTPTAVLTILNSAGAVLKTINGVDAV